MASFGCCLSFIITFTLLSLPQIFCSCPESISHFNKTIIDNGLGPLNATEYVGGTTTFTGTVPATCSLLRLYIDGCYSSKINVNITNIGNNMKRLSYVTPVLNMSHDGTAYDICTHCGGDRYECFPTATLKVKDKPVLNVNAIATCNGIQVEGQKDNDTVIMATVKDSLNHTVLHCNISSLPNSINYTVLPPDIDFNIEFAGVNPAGVGEPLEQAVSFENLIYFKIKLVKVLYEDNKVKAIIRFAFDNTCIMSRAHAMHVKSTCAVGGSRSFSISNSNTITVDMLQSRRKCTFTLSSGKTSHTTAFYDTRPVTATIRPHNTTDGYFNFTGRLLQGVLGIVIQIVRSNNTIHSTQYVPRDSPHNNQIKGSNTKQLEDGNYRVNIYLMKANKTFDPSSLIKTIQMYCIISTATNTMSITTPETRIHTRKELAIGLIIFAVLVVASFFVILLFCFSPKLQGIFKDFDVKKLCQSSYVFDSQWLMGVIQLPPFLSFNDEGSCQSSKEDCRESKNTVGAVTGNESPAVAYSKPETDKKAPETDGNQSTMNSTPYVSFQSESDLLPSPDKNEQFLNQDFNSGPSGFVGNPLNAPPHIVVNTLDQKPTFPVPVANFADNLVVLESEVRKRKLSRAFSQEGETKQEDNNATAAFVFPHEVFDTAGDKKTQPH
ncbi:PREDICTED: uncharacterized protein LOC100638822 [Amphimedon queenslandica]|uniref:Uncharacterized protein n=1 Tax=Amphimedon queenslandica TaxID=400682 RepID=A0A1X7TVI0_AMPQE|nr:PREDICTED: uncharacterized protein LOC100638822 [Amphimedon queenslandica]|eukprot:XP_019857482.1 PREDICTED: uncharacterized protein LOC100638822 [Amphimedon queenslandica]